MKRREAAGVVPVELTSYRRPISSVFDLLGRRETDLTAALGWVLARSRRLRDMFLDRCALSIGGDIEAVRLETADVDGRTDIELVREGALVVIEAKRGWQLPTVRQLASYSKRVVAAGGGALIAVTEADIDWDDSGDPKTGDRLVPIPPRLVELLRSWIADHHLVDEDLLFRTRLGNRPSESNWLRALKRACESAGQPRIRVYDFRHASATMMIRAGVPLAEAARRLGHSVETLVSTYIGAMEGDDTEANTLLDGVLAATREAIVAPEPPAN